MADCPTINPTTCCEVLLDHETQLIPPALAGSTFVTSLITSASVENVCPEKVVICGVVSKVLAYTAVTDTGSQIPFAISDDIPFQCFIDRDDANEFDIFTVTGAAIVCSFPAPGEQNFGTKAGFLVAFKYAEKEIVKVCVTKVSPGKESGAAP